MIRSWLLKMLVQNWLRVALIAGILAVAGGIWAAGYRTAWRIAERETLQATIASQKRDIDAGRIQRKADQDTIARLEAQALEDEAQYERLRVEAAKTARPGITQRELDLLLGRKGR